MERPRLIWHLLHAATNAVIFANAVICLHSLNSIRMHVNHFDI